MISAIIIANPKTPIPKVIKDLTKKEANELFLEVLEEGIPFFQVLSDKYRQQIVVALSEVDEMNVTSIVEKIDLSRPAVSHHLKLLKQVGLVTSEKRGKEIFFSLTIAKPLKLLKDMTSVIENHCTIR